MWTGVLSSTKNYSSWIH
nr:unnamed protein product [Callosobruchus analis]